MRRKPNFAFRALLALVLALALSARATAQTIEPSAPVGESAEVHYAYPLSKFVPTPGPLVLRDASIAEKIAIPVSGRLKLKTMTLTLNFTNSIALVPQTSVLSVRFNETTLAQIRLDRDSPVATARVNLPVELVRPGYNTLTLAVTQHNGDQCEDPEAPELWTEVNTVTSKLEIDGEYTTVPQRLADLDQILSPGIGGARRLALVLPPLANDSAAIQNAALVGEAVALRAQYESVALQPHILGDAPSGQESWALDDQVLIGTRDQLGAVLGADEAASIQGPYLALYSLDHRQVRLVVSGRTAQEVMLAARALTYIDIPITDAVSAAIKGITEGPQTKVLEPERIYGLGELGVPTTTLTGMGTQKITLNLPMPPDLYAPEQATVDLLLDLDYGAGMGPGSVINVDLNGKFLHSISMTNEGGSAFRGYRLSIPLRDMIGGPNQVNFGVIMRPVRKDRCVGASGRNLAMTLFDTSSVAIPAAAHVAAQPDLALMVRTGFPYASSAAPTRVWVSDPSLLVAGWSVLGRLAQVSGGPIAQLEFSIGGEPPRGPAILIGEVKSLPPRIFDHAMQAFGQVHRVPYRVFDAVAGVAAPGLLARMMPIADAPRLPDTPLPQGTVQQASDLGDSVIMTAVPADGGQGTVTVLTAQSRDRLLLGAQQLVSAQYWGQAQGDFMLWKSGPDAVVTLRLSPRFQIGTAPPVMSLRFYISQHPWSWLGGTIVLLMALSGLTVWLLARRRGPRI
jgi:hypothetical protein